MAQRKREMEILRYDDPAGDGWDSWGSGYVRVSTDAQAEEGYSIDAQIDSITHQAALLNIRRLKLYVDGGFSGSNIDRPAVQRLIRDTKAKRITHVIVYKLDRLSRSQKDTLFLIEDVFNMYGVDFNSIMERLDTGTAMGRLMIGILSAFAQLERENIRERTRMGMLERVKEGKWMGGGRTPFGYDYDAEQGILVPNKDADTVRMIYKLYLEGYALYRIASMVGLKYERLARQILGRRSNCGYIVYNDVEYKGRHEAIIDEDTYERAMQMQRERGLRHIHPASSHLLTGLLRCGQCGARMRYQKWGKTGVKLVCYSQQNTHPNLIRDRNCAQEKVWAHQIEEAVLHALFSLALNREEGSAHKAVEKSVLDILDGQMEAAAKRLRNLYSLYANDRNEILLETIEGVKKEMRGIESQIRAEQERNTLSRRRAELRDQIVDIESAWPVLSEQEQKALIREVIGEITIEGQEVHIRFTI